LIPSNFLNLSLSSQIWKMFIHNLGCCYWRCTWIIPIL